MYLLKKKKKHNREMEGFDGLIFLCMPVLMNKDLLLTNTASWDWNNAWGLLHLCLHQPQRDLNMLELNSLVHLTGMSGLLGPSLILWRVNSRVVTGHTKAKLFPQPHEWLRVGSGTSHPNSCSAVSPAVNGEDGTCFPTGCC